MTRARGPERNTGKERIRKITCTRVVGALCADNALWGRRQPGRGGMSGGFERLADLETAPTPKIPPGGFAMGVAPPAEIAAGSADRTTAAFMDDADRRLSWEARRAKPPDRAAPPRPMRLSSPSPPSLPRPGTSLTPASPRGGPKPAVDALRPRRATIVRVLHGASSRGLFTYQGGGAQDELPDS